MALAGGADDGPEFAQLAKFLGSETMHTLGIDLYSLFKVVNKLGEEYKVAVRNIRRDSNEMLKLAKKDGEISEDDAFKGQDSIQEITNAFITRIDDTVKEKEAEILEF